MSLLAHLLLTIHIAATRLVLLFPCSTPLSSRAGSHLPGHTHCSCVSAQHCKCVPALHSRRDRSHQMPRLDAVMTQLRVRAVVDAALAVSTVRSHAHPACIAQSRQRDVTSGRQPKVATRSIAVVLVCQLVRLLGWAYRLPARCIRRTSTTQPRLSTQVASSLHLAQTGVIQRVSRSSHERGLEAGRLVGIAVVVASERVGIEVDAVGGRQMQRVGWQRQCADSG